MNPRMDDHVRREPPDLQTQFEALLDTVWALEDEWALDDRIDLALKFRRPTRSQ